MTNRLSSTVTDAGYLASASAETPVESAFHVGIVLRRGAIIVLMLLLIVPTLWTAVTGQRTLRIDGAISDTARSIAIIAPAAGDPQIGQMVVVRTATTPSSVAVGRVADVGDGTVALRDLVSPAAWTASVTDLSGSVLAVFDGPVAAFLADLPPMAASTVIIFLIVTLVALPLRKSDLDDANAVQLPLVRHHKDIADLGPSQS
ncbi:hypothetical protein [Mycetocola zhujimingii]|uniref:hypothetical protein n=1 Tax=Mycetocola zhujimingii TaxID=2079792 RepID=UPI000D39E9DC|nr:hypothetical protein [Mycetocola zhujimingii]AWB87558.1 hypothetical protein C3E77_13710 [Mycetocola zhujimingii]